MHFSGSVDIAAPQAAVWAFLTDPNAVGQCVPDLQSIEVVNADAFKATVKAGIGPVRGKFNFDVHWADRAEPSHARMIAKGKTPGSAVTVDSGMDLAPTSTGGTTLTWTADVVVHGMIASVGARLLTGFTEKQTELFFGCIRTRLESAPE